MSRLWGLLVTLLVIGHPAAATAEALTTPTIIARTTSAALSCMKWTPIGMCFWLRCSISGCHVRTSLKVGHYNPDFVISTFNSVGGNPWSEARATLGAAERLAASSLLGRVLAFPVGSAGNRTEGDPGHRDHRNLLFRESDAIGNPVSTFTQLPYSLVCRSEATPLEPYFESAFDALAWRNAVPESLYPASWIPGQREVGAWPLQTWGSVYPRNGWVTQSEEPKAAAIIAQRTGDIVTRTAQPHVYLPLRPPKPKRQRVWPPGPLVENDERSGTWQMLSPRADASCAVFGKRDMGLRSAWSSGRVDVGGEYSWNLWRPYKCCRARGQVFVYSIDWSEYPP